MGVAELLGSNSFPHVVDDDLNLEETAGNRDIGDPANKFPECSKTTDKICTRNRGGHIIWKRASSDSSCNGRPRHDRTSNAALQILRTRESVRECLGQALNDPNPMRKRGNNGTTCLCKGFDEALDLIVRTGNSSDIQTFDRANRVLSFEICRQVAPRGAVVLQTPWRTSRTLLRRTLISQQA